MTLVIKANTDPSEICLLNDNDEERKVEKRKEKSNAIYRLIRLEN
jgi:hypothetical protein